MDSVYSSVDTCDVLNWKLSSHEAWDAFELKAEKGV